MRLNYERCLLDFENYLGSGQYAADLAAGTAPHHTSVTEPQRNFGHLPPPDMGAEGDAGGTAANMVLPNPNTASERRAGTAWSISSQDTM